MTLKSDTIILAIESSCDDTAAAVIKNGKICSNIVAGQEVHEKYGGVIPELASRAHQQNIIPVIDQALKVADISRSELSAIAYTQGPGLLGSLLVGSSFAKAFAMSLQLPLIGVNHLQAHVLAHFIENPELEFPFLCLLVSGGHTQIVLVRSTQEMEIIGTTLDDAAGEAFDKSAKILGLPYPGGPLIDKYAQSGDPLAYKLPDSRVGELNYSFSGLKTAVLYFVRDRLKEDADFVKNNLNDICASIQYTIVSYLLRKMKKAILDTGIKRIGLAGGVSANSYLRSQFAELATEMDAVHYIPSFEYCTDNAAMIAMAAHFSYLNKDFAELEDVPFARYDY